MTILFSVTMTTQMYVVLQVQSSKLVYVASNVILG
jgi:hypothetical protein